MVVYVDILFSYNFLLDAVILQTTAWAARAQTSWWKIALAAAIGASYVLMVFAPSLSFMFTFIVKVLFSVVMLLVAFGFRSLQAFVRNAGYFYAANFTLAGGIFGIHYVLQSSNELVDGMLFTASGGMAPGFQSGGWLIIVIFFAMVAFYRLQHKAHERRTSLTQTIAELEVQIGSYQTACSGLIDTGNRLYDPLTRTPVMVMELAQWPELLPEKLQQSIERKNVDEMLQNLSEEAGEWRDRIRLVPFKSVQQSHQFMLAIKPDKVVIKHQAD